MMLGIGLAIAFGVCLVLAGMQGYNVGKLAGVEGERRRVVRFLAARGATRSSDELAKAIAEGEHRS